MKFKITIIYFFIAVLFSIESMSQNVVADFKVIGKTTGCGSFIATFHNYSTNATSTSWTMGDQPMSFTFPDNADFTYPYSKPGIYTVTLTANGIGGPSKKSFVIKVFPNVDPTITMVNGPFGCDNNNISFTSTMPVGSAAVANYYWNFADGTPFGTTKDITHKFTVPNTYSVFLKIIDTNGCDGNSNIYAAKISQPPVAAYTYSPNPASFCQSNLPATITLTDKSTFWAPRTLTYKWTVNGTTVTTKNTSFIAPTYGNYNAKLVVTDDWGCKDSTLNTTIPVQKFFAAINLASNTVCPNTQINFFSAHQEPGVTNTWTLSNVPGSKTQNFYTVKYTTPGTYTVKLSSQVVGGASSCVADTTISIVVEDLKANIGVSNTYVCGPPQLINLTDKSTSDVSTITKWNWTIKGTTFNTQDVPYNAQLIGSYPVQLIVTSKNGCKDTATTNFQVAGPLDPKISIIQDSGCVHRSVAFDDLTSYNPPAPSKDKISSWAWTFDDVPPGSSTLKSPTHTYDTPGKFDATLTIKTDSGCTATVKQKVKVGHHFVPNFTIVKDTVCPKDDVALTDLTPDPLNELTYWHWYPKGGDKKQGMDKFDSDTGWTIENLVVGMNGCMDTAKKLDSVYTNGPVITNLAALATTCADPLTVKFNYHILKTTSWHWDFGDGTTIDTISSTGPKNQSSIDASITHTYASGNNYLVTLKALNDVTGCEHSKTVHITIAKIGLPDFTVTKACARDSVNFMITSTNDATNFTWDFGDGSPTITKTTTAINHKYSAGKYYTVRLTTKDLNGCAAPAPGYIEKSVEVYQINPEFTTDPTTHCPPFNSTISDASVVFANPTPYTREWSYNGTPFGTGADPEIFAVTDLSTKIYPIQLKVTYGNGLCTDIITHNINAFFPNADFIVKPYNCSGDSILFTPSDPTLTSYSWNFGAGLGMPNSAKISPKIKYADTGKYNVTLNVTDSYGCPFQITKPVGVKSASVSLVSNFPTVDCYKKQFPVISVVAPRPNLRYNWYFDGNLTTIPNTQDSSFNIFNSSQLGIHHYKVIAWVNDFGYSACRDTTTLDLNVSGPTGSYTIDHPKICIGDTISLRATNLVNVKSYEWWVGSMKVDDKPHFNKRYNGDSTGYIKTTLFISSSADCQVPIDSVIYIYDAKARFVASKSQACANDGIVFTNNSIGATTWSWNFGDGKVEQNSPSPLTHVYPTRGTYYPYLTIIGQIDPVLQCKDTIRDTINVYNYPSLTVKGNTYLCQSSTEQLNANTDVANPLWNWAPAEGLDYTTISNPHAKPFNTTTYTITVTDPVSNCATTATSKVNVQDPINILDGKITPQNKDTTIHIGEIVPISIVTSDPAGTIAIWTPTQWLSCTTCLNPIAKPMDDRDYQISIKDSLGCFPEQKANISIKVDKRFVVEMPNAFTPEHTDCEGDKCNNIVYVKGWGIKDLLEYKIYNRWGQVVFSTDDIHIGWDGYFKGTLQSMDTYVYLVRVRSYENIEKELKGYLNLLR